MNMVMILASDLLLDYLHLILLMHVHEKVFASDSVNFHCEKRPLNYLN